VANAAARRQDGPRASMSIGEVLTALRPDFPDVTISKIRFLEEQGLIDPERTPSGYRKFAHADVERLRFVLSVQRDHYLPLRVIRDHLDALDAGLDPAPLPGAPRVPRLVPDVPAPEQPTSYSRRELLAAADAEGALLDELESYGLTSQRPGGGYDAEALAVLRAAAGLARFGIGPRHLRPFRTAADREAGLVEQVVAPLRRQRGPEAAGRADETAREVAALCARLHAALVSSALQRPAP
jgi:DNA-binding transcriptional MerR regulator